jgi:tyrosyl-tRNA synthetase
MPGIPSNTCLRALNSTDSKIDLLDSPEVVTKKIKKAMAAPKVVEENGVLAFVEYVLLPVSALKGNREFRVERERDGLEPLVYTAIAQMHEDYKNDVVCPLCRNHSILLS